MTDTYIQIGDIKGESTDSAHAAWIEVMSWSFGAAMPVSHNTSGDGSRTTERVSVQNLVISKLMDASSSVLLQRVCDGKHIAKATLQMYRADGSARVLYQEYVLTDVIVSSYSVGGGGGTPSESITLDFGTIKWTFKPSDKKLGTVGDAIPGGWSLIENKAI